MSMAASFPLSQLRTSTSAGQVWLRSGVRLQPDSIVSKMAELNKNVTRMIVASCFTGQGGGDLLTNHLYFVLKLTMTFFHTANQTVDSLHNDHSPVCATFHNCIDLKTPVVGKQLMVCVHVTSSAKGRGMQSLLEKPIPINCRWTSYLATTIRSAPAVSSHNAI